MEPAHEERRGPEPWTTAVAWARPWRRPAPPNPMDEKAWRLAVTELLSAEDTLARAMKEVPDDPWPEVVAAHAVFQARRRVREAQAALAQADADLAWSTT